MNIINFKDKDPCEPRAILLSNNEFVATMTNGVTLYWRNCIQSIKIQGKENVYGHFETVRVCKFVVPREEKIKIFESGNNR